MIDEEKDDKPSYFQEWYDLNGKALNDTRRDRYSTDPEYREKVLAQNRVARKKKRDAAKVERLARRDAQKVVPSKSWKTVNVEVKDGNKTKIVKMFTIGAVAAALDCSPGALRLWEAKGIIEETPNRYTKGDRLYTLDQIEHYKERLTKLGRIGPDKVVINTLPYVERRILLHGKKRTRKLRLFRIGALAKVIGRTVNTVEGLARNGNIPETPFRATEAGSRLYTLGMIEDIKCAFDRRDGDIRGEEEWKKVFAEIERSWDSSGISGAIVIEDQKQ